MKKLFLIPGVIISAVFASASFADAPKEATPAVIENPVVSNEWVMGDVWVKEIQDKYNAGGYDSFLKDLDQKYQEAKDNPTMGNMPSLEQAYAEMTPEMKEKISTINKALRSVDQKTQKSLSDIAKQYPDSFVAKVIQSAFSSDENKNTDPLAASELIYKKDDPVAKEMRGVIQEYNLKRNLLAMDALQTMQNDRAAMQEKSFVLYLDQMHKMGSIAQKNPNAPLSKYISETQADYPKNAAASHDRDYLIALGNKKRMPANDAEQKTSEIMADYLVKKSQIQSEYIK